MSLGAGVAGPINHDSIYSLDWLTPYKEWIQDAGRKTARPCTKHRQGMIQMLIVGGISVTLDWLTPESAINATHDAIAIYALDWLTPLRMIQRATTHVLINLWTG